MIDILCFLMKEHNITHSLAKNKQAKLTLARPLYVATNLQEIQREKHA